MTLAIDGTASTSVNAASAAVTLTTANANDVIIVHVYTQGAPVVSVTSAHLTFTKIISHQTNSASFSNEEWRAIAASPLTSEVITVTPTASATTNVVAFGISGANTTTPSDTGGPQGNTFAGVSETTANANDIIIGFSAGNTAVQTVDTGFTALYNLNFSMSEYKIVSATGTYTIDASNAGVGAIVDAIVQASGGGAARTPTLTLMGVG